MTNGVPLRVVDGLTLDPEHRAVLRPGELVRDRERRLRRLPRFFYEVRSWDVALETPLSPHFEAWEFMNVDVREAELLRMAWPRYLPCAVAALAAHLELFRREVGTYVHVAANGGYRSPAHRLNAHATPFSWGAAASIYRVGDDWMDSEQTVLRYRRVAQHISPGLWIPPGPPEDGIYTDLELSLGFLTVVPPDAPGEEEEA